MFTHTETETNLLKAGRSPLPENYCLPRFLWAHPGISKGEPGRRTAITFCTPELAVDALSDVLVDVAKRG